MEQEKLTRFLIGMVSFLLSITLYLLNKIQGGYNFENNK